MGSDQRTYIKVHDGILDHPKVVGLSYAGIVTYLAALTYCSRYLTDGRVPAAAVKKFGTPRAAFLEVVHAGLVEPDGDDWEVHDYLEHQRSADEVAELREKRRSAGMKGGRAKANALASATGDAKQTASKPVAESETESSSKEELGGAAPRADVERLCKRLADGVEANGSKRPTITKAWRSGARLLLDVDGRELEKAERLIDWSQQDSFWKTNIHSMAKFRAQYDALRLKALAEHAKAEKETQESRGSGWTLPDPPPGVEPGTPEWRQWATAERDKHVGRSA